MRAAPWIAGLCLAGCGGQTELPLEIDTDQWVLFLSTIDGEPKAQLVQRESGRALSVQSDDETPIYSWLIPNGAFIDPSGRTLTNADIGQATIRHRKTEGGEAGSCGRCMIHSTAAPQVALPGDACPIPAFLPGALWAVADAERTCKGSADGTVCAAGNGDDLAAIEEARVSVQIEWPGACACTGAPPAKTLRDIEIRPIAPEAPGSSPMNAVTETADGLVVGVCRDKSFVFDPRTGQTTLAPLDLDLTITDLFPLRTGDLAIFGESFNTGGEYQTTVYRMGLTDGALGEPELVTAESPLLPAFFTYLEGDPGELLWQSGLQRGGTAFEPAIYACDDQSLGCAQVPLVPCTRAGYYGSIRDLEMLPDGTGVGFSYAAMYVKAARPAPMINPHPSDAWACQEAPAQVPFRAPSTEPPVPISYIGAMATHGQRVYVCAESVQASCEPNYVVIMTATVTPGAAVAPLDFEVVYKGGDWSRCRQFLDVPGLDGARAVLSGQVVLDFDASGRLVSDRRIADVYGPVSGLQSYQQAQPGSLIAWATENRVLISNGSTVAFTQAYGPPETVGAHYDALIALDDGDFLAFGHPDAFLRVEITEASDFPVTTLTPIPDPTGARSEGDLRVAVLDRAASTEDHLEILTGGKRDSMPYLTRYTIDGSGLGAAGDLRLPEGLGDVAVVGLAEIGPSSFLAIVQGSQVLAIEGNKVSLVEIDYDDPTTTMVESRPIRGADQCTREVPRLDLWQSVGGGHGVGWVGGTDEMVLRVTGHRATRFTVQGTNNVAITTIDAVCPDQVHFAGQGREARFGGDFEDRMQLFRTSGQVTTTSGLATDPRRLQITRIGVDELASVVLYDIAAGRPRALLRDTAPGQLGRGERPFTVVLDSGFLHRMFVSERIQYTRAPFGPLIVAPSPKGWVLFGGGESRLALGVPR